MHPSPRGRLFPLFAAALGALLATTSGVRAQVQIDDVLPVTYGVGNQGATGLPIVASYDASGSDKLVVVVGTEHAFGTSFGMSVNSLEYNGVAMIEAVQENTLPGTAAVFYLDNPGPAGEIRIIQGNQNGGRATIYALSNVAPGVDGVGQSVTSAVDVATTGANGLVIAGIFDGGQFSNGNGAGAPTALTPLTQTHSGTWGNAWGGFCSGHQVAASPGVTTSTFATSGLLRLRAVAVSFAEGCTTCSNGAQASVVSYPGGAFANITTTSTGALGCKLNWTVSGATPSSVGLFAVSLGFTAVPLSALLPACGGTIYTPFPEFLATPTDATGGAALNLPMPLNQSFCGLVVTGQYAELQPGSCPLAVTGAVVITVGN